MTLDELAQKLLPKRIYQKLYAIRHLQKLSMRKGSYLVETGYINSIKRMEPVDKEGAPIPWMNYSFIDFIEPRLNKSMTVFEYGAGYSTLYLSDKVKTVTSIEYDKDWFEKVKRDLEVKGNCEVEYYPEPEKYIKAITDIDKGPYDLIIVDGRDREECIKYITPYLSENGVIILDDSWKKKFDKVFEYFREKGFKEISFTGLKAGGMIVDKTTVFYRSNNVLGI